MAETMKPVGYAHKTSHGWVVSKTPLSPDSEPVFPESMVREAVERVRPEADCCNHCQGWSDGLDAFLREFNLEDR